MFHRLIVPAAAVLLVLPAAASSAQTVSPEYAAVQQRLASGWNTWDTRSVLTQVLLPEGLALRAGVKNQTTENGDAYLESALIGRQGKDVERVTPGPHAYDGSYTDLKLEWRGHQMRVQSAHVGQDVVWLFTPEASTIPASQPAEIVLSATMLWGLPGSVAIDGDHLLAQVAGHQIPVFMTSPDTHDVNVPAGGAYLTANLDRAVGISTGRPRSIAEIQAALEAERQAYERSVSAFGTHAPLADAIQTVIGWDTIFEPQGKRVISPVSRIWSVSWGGYVLFDWDNYFASTLAALGDKDLAYANAMEITREITRQGFIPNYARSNDWKSEDRSEPPVGAMSVLGLYRQFGDQWFLRDTFDGLLRWNRWWAQHRDMDGYLTWGSDGENQPANLDDNSKGTRAGAILESGLDNSPMYDNTYYNPATHQLEFADVGLMSMYIADCDALAQIANILGKRPEASELQQRAAKYRRSLQTLWNPETGLFLNKDLHTGQWSYRLSPTNFYPLMAKAASQQQAETMIERHLLNPKEFWGEWVIPSIARDDPAFHDQDYWRGRIWGPMNYLVYLGLRNYQGPQIDSARQQLAQKSQALFLKGWDAHRHVHENYNAITGEGDDVTNSDRFYHWGALLGLIDLEEQGGAASPGKTAAQPRPAP
jgi:putative isomerase